jgi:hypothetical protein
VLPGAGHWPPFPLKRAGVGGKRGEGRERNGMDVKAYFQKVRGVEKSLGAGTAVVVSLETPDGGRAGRVMELPVELAARMLVDRRARLAEAGEAERHREQAELERMQCEARQIEPQGHFLAEIADARKKGRR